MPQKYSGLSSLIAQDDQAKKYFASLPDYVKDQISTRADSVNTYALLRDYAENLLRGDD